MQLVKALSLLTFLVVPLEIYADDDNRDIKIELVGELTKDTNDLRVFYTGKNTAVISQKERNSFGLSDDALTHGFDLLFGQRPQDVYVCSPTPWGDLYVKNYNKGWRQVERVIYPTYARVVKSNYAPQVITEHRINNPHNFTLKFKAGVSQSRKNMVSFGWTKSQTVSVDASIGFSYGPVSGEVTAGYSNSWGTNKDVETAVGVKKTQTLEKAIDAHTKKVAQVRAVYKLIKAVVDYNVYLTGTAFCNYYPAYRGGHFKPKSVNVVMKKLGLPRQIKITQDITLGIYGSTEVKFADVTKEK